MRYLFLLPILLAATTCQCQSASKDTTVTHFFRRTSGWIASDGAITIPLSDGRTLWLMGDSHIDDYDPATSTVNCLFQVRNAALVQPHRDWHPDHTTTLTGTGPGIKSFLKNNPDDQFFIWPGAGIQLRDTIYIYCANMKNAKSDLEGFGFAHAGNDCWAKVKFPELTVTGYAPLQNFDEIGFGIGFIHERNWVYVYGQKLKGLTNELFIGRFSAAHPENAWQFWNGAEWSDNIKDIKPIAAQTGVSGTFQVSRVGKRMLLVSSALSMGCDQGKEIYSSVSDHLTGPFTEKQRVYTIDDTLQGHYPFFYAVVAHPEFLADSRDLLFTYCINGYGACVSVCTNGRMDPDYYRPKAFRVPLSAIGLASVSAVKPALRSAISRK